jgi:hypothetical protein
MSCVSHDFILRYISSHILHSLCDFILVHQLTQLATHKASPHKIISIVTGNCTCLSLAGCWYCGWCRQLYFGKRIYSVTFGASRSMLPCHQLYSGKETYTVTLWHLHTYAPSTTIWTLGNTFLPFFSLEMLDQTVGWSSIDACLIGCRIQISSREENNYLPRIICIHYPISCI